MLNRKGLTLYVYFIPEKPHSPWKIQELARGYEVVPVAIETMGPMNPDGADFINGIGRKCAQQTGDQPETSFLWQRLSITLQRFNAVCFRGSFKLEDLE